MLLVRHCAERLPGGIRRWVKVARRAGFDGTLYVRGFRPRDHDANGRVTLGSQFNNRIVVRLNAPCGTATTIRPVDPLQTFAHELGHWNLQQQGRKNTNGVDFKSNTEQAKDPIERACDRYAAKLLRDL